MAKMIFDYGKGDVFFKISDNMATDSNGNLYTSVSDRLIFTSDGGVINRISDNLFYDSRTKNTEYVIKCANNGFFTLGNNDKNDK